MLPEGSHSLLPDLNQHRIRPSKNEPDAYSTPSTSRRVTFEGLQAPAADEEVAARGRTPFISIVLCVPLPLLSMTLLSILQFGPVLSRVRRLFSTWQEHCTPLLTFFLSGRQMAQCLADTLPLRYCSHPVRRPFS